MAKELSTTGTPWVRVVTTAESAGDKKRRLANAARVVDKKFNDACAAVGIEATKRQASKFNNKYGKAYNFLQKGII